MAAILSYNLNPGEEAALRALCGKMGFRCRPVSPEEYGLSIGALAGIPVAKAAQEKAAAFHEPMLVICGLLAPQLDALLQGLREPGMPRVALKAVLTPSNVAWNSAQLRDELLREHEAFRRQEK